MKLQLPVCAFGVALLASGPVLAQGSFQGPPRKPGTFSSPSPGYTPPAPKTYEAPRPKVYGAPEPPKAEPFKPYEPYKPKSVFGPDGKPKR